VADLMMFARRGILCIYTENAEKTKPRKEEMISSGLDSWSLKSTKKFLFISPSLDGLLLALIGVQL
jgi:hypothetical protein